VILVVVYMRRRNDKRMKYFLLIAGDNYYPSGDTGDWIECYQTYEEALNTITEIPKKWPNGQYKINDRIYDWYYIVDLKEWIYI